MDLFSPDLTERAAALLQRYREAKAQLVTAESCTGGLIAGLFTEIPGASDVVERGFVTYSNDAKMECLGVPNAILAQHGAVSAQTAKEMALGALKAAPRATHAVAVTGIAGPDGGTAEKPVGLVYIGIATPEGVAVERHFFHENSRTGIRLATVEAALSFLESQP